MWRVHYSWPARARGVDEKTQTSVRTQAHDWAPVHEMIKRLSFNIAHCCTRSSAPVHEMVKLRSFNIAHMHIHVAWPPYMTW